MASIALYGDIEECLELNKFNPKFNIYGARVLDRDNKFPKEKLIENQITEVIAYFYKEKGCRILNLSIGIEEDTYMGGKQFTLAQRIDEMCREFDIFVCISAGNFKGYPYCEEIEYEKTIREYPNYLLQNNAQIINPATSALALTVGSLTSEPRLTLSEERGVNVIPVSTLNQPSPFTRIGFGVNDSIKPEVCEYGGGCVLNIYGATLQKITTPFGAGVIGCNSKFREKNKLFTSGAGTSFATPRIANLAAEILDKYKNSSANFIRALIVNSCNSVEETISLIDEVKKKMVYSLYSHLESIGVLTACPEINEHYEQGKFNENIRREMLANNLIPAQVKEFIEKIPDRYSYMKFAGYGKPDLSRALYSSEKKVTMFAEDEIEIDHFKVFEIYVPEELAVLKGKKRISITLAFSPPTRHTRKDYIGYDMDFKLIRGMELRDIIDVFRKKEKGEDITIKLESCNCKLSHGTNILKNSTVKNSTFEFSSKKFCENYGEVLHLVIFNESKWVDDTYGKEPYSVVVTIEYLGDEIECNLYTRMKERINERLEITARARMNNNLIKLKY